MLSTHKPKAKQKRSRQSDVTSDIENLIVMFGSFSRNEDERHLSEDEESVDLRSITRPSNTNPNEECCRTLLNTNSRGSRDITPDTVRMKKVRLPVKS